VAAVQARSSWAFPGMLLGLALAVGLLAGVDPRLGLAAAMGVAFVTVVMADLTAGLSLYALIAFLNVVPNVGGSFLSFDKVAGALLALSWLASVARSRGVRNAFITSHPYFAVVLGFFLLWVVLSLTWSEFPSLGLEPASRYVLNAFLFLIVFTAVRERRHVVWLVGAFVASSTLAGGYGLIVPSAGERLGGTIGEPNQLAAVLVAGVVLAAALAGVVRGPLLRIALMGASALCLTATFLTLSRAGLIALICAMLAAIVVAGKWRVPAIAFATLALSSLFVFFAFFATPEQRDRVTQINGGSGRSDIWKVGWRMVQANPIKGVGTGQFQSSSKHYLIEAGAIQRSDLIIDQPKVAHNIYLQELSELGVIGLIPFLAILVFPLWCALKAAREFDRMGDPGLELMSRAIVVGLIGILAADFFASEQFSKQLWLLLGLGPALLAMARLGGGEQEHGHGDGVRYPLAPQRLEPAPALAAGRPVGT
jgi:exopolysaccharide production protein ExoQ